jgi:hypothetical protein
MRETHRLQNTPPLKQAAVCSVCTALHVLHCRQPAWYGTCLEPDPEPVSSAMAPFKYTRSPASQNCRHSLRAQKYGLQSGQHRLPCTFE